MIFVGNSNFSNPIDVEFMDSSAGFKKFLILLYYALLETRNIPSSPFTKLNALSTSTNPDP